jgi:hypothetical protein
MCPIQSNLRVPVGVVPVRCGQEGDEDGGLQNVEIARVFAEIHPGCCLDPVSGAAKEDAVEVDEENVLLAEVQFEDGGEHRLGEGFADQYAVPLEIDLLEGLLRQRAAALRPARDGREQGPREGLRVDAEVLVEAPVLTRNGRVDEVGRQLPVGDWGRVIGPTRGDELTTRGDDPDARLPVVDDELPGISQFQRRSGGGGCGGGETGEREEPPAVKRDKCTQENWRKSAPWGNSSPGRFVGLAPLQRHDRLRVALPYARSGAASYPSSVPDPGLLIGGRYLTVIDLSR